MEHGIWLVTGFIISAIFGLVGIIFTQDGENACRFILGYSLKSKEERQEYDEAGISRHYRNMFILWSLTFLFGAFSCVYFGKVCFGISCFIWLLSFCRNIHIDEDKDFDKFKKS